MPTKMPTKIMQLRLGFFTDILNYICYTSA